jgi:nephrocystin-3
MMPPLNESHQREIRAFISSTFRDMHQEREELVKVVFPQLRKLCERRGVIWGEVDLRWGVTEEQKAEGKVLPICLAEIQRCRPYFIGLLGERYGWVPDVIPQELVERELWLGAHRNHSVTELEILHGVLNNPQMAGHAFFYLRDPAYIDSLPAQVRPDYVAESAESAAKLRALKERIRTHGFPVREDYSNPKALGRMVLEDLTALIDNLFPEGSAPNSLDREAAEHEAFATSRARVYIGRDEYFQRLDQHAAGNGPPLAVLGESGLGKTALLANWAIRQRVRRPKELLLMHFVGSTPGSTDWVMMLRRILEEFNRRLSLDVEIPGKAVALRTAFANALYKVAAKGRVVLVLDGLNQLDDSDGAPELLWLPPEMPANLRLVISTLPGRVLSEIGRRGWPTLEVKPLTGEERIRLIGAYLAQYSKKLDTDLVRRIAEAAPAANPLYLRALLEELRLYGDHGTLKARTEYYLAARNAHGLYQKILERYEADYDRERPALVRDSMTLIWGGRRGLSESELLDLLGSGDAPLPQAVWSPLSLAVEPSLMIRSGLICFSHDYLRQAVETRYLAADPLRVATHSKLADYFESRAMSERKLDEFPWQLAQAREWKRLQSCVSDIPIFLALLNDSRQYELLGYWLQMGKLQEVVPTYQRSLDSFLNVHSDPDLALMALERVASFFQLAGHLKDAAEIYRRLLPSYEKRWGERDQRTAACLNNLALTLTDQGRFAEAELFQRRALDAIERRLGSKHSDVARALENLGLLFQRIGNLPAAGDCLRRALAIVEEVEGHQSPAAAMAAGLLGRLLTDMGDYTAAEALLHRALHISVGLHGGDHPDTISHLNNLGLLQLSRGDYAAAEKSFRSAANSLARVLGPTHTQYLTTMNNLAGALTESGDWAQAEKIHRDVLAVCEKRLGPDHPDVARSLGNLALLMDKIGNPTAAEAFYHRSLAILEKAFGPNHPDTAKALGALGLLAEDSGQYGEAERLLRRALTICEGALGADHPDTSTSLNNLAGLLVTKEEFDQAERLYRRSLAICEKAFGTDHPDFAGTLDNLAALLMDKRDYSAAEPLARRALEIRERVFGPDHSEVALSLNNYGMLLSDLGERDRAEEALRRCLAIREKTLGSEHPGTATALSNLSCLLMKRERYEEADALCRRALAIREKSLGPSHLDVATTVSNLSCIYSDVGLYETAAALMDRARHIRENVLGPADPLAIRTRELADRDRQRAHQHAGEPYSAGLDDRIADYVASLLEQKGVCPKSDEEAQKMMFELGVFYGQHARQVFYQSLPPSEQRSYVEIQNDPKAVDAFHRKRPFLLRKAWLDAMEPFRQAFMRL